MRQVLRVHRKKLIAAKGGRVREAYCLALIFAVRIVRSGVFCACQDIAIWIKDRDALKAAKRWERGINETTAKVATWKRLRRTLERKDGILRLYHGNRLAV